MTRQNLLSIFAGATSTLLATAFPQKAATPKTPDKYALAEEHARELLLLMDTDKNGEISKEEWMRFRDISGGRVIRHTREHHTNRVGNAFRIAAQSLVRGTSYLGARYRYLRAKLGGLRAVKAMARVLACLFYRLLTQGPLWIDRGADEFERRRQQRDLASLQRRARSLGMQLIPATSSL